MTYPYIEVKHQHNLFLNANNFSLVSQFYSPFPKTTLPTISTLLFSTLLSQCSLDTNLFSLYVSKTNKVGIY